MLQQRIMLVERFVQARKMVKTDPAETVKICTQLLSSQSRIDNAIRIGEVTKPISPRNTITIAQYANDFEDRLGHAAAFQRALERNLFNAMDEGERAIAIGIADRNS